MRAQKTEPVGVRTKESSEGWSHTAPEEGGKAREPNKASRGGGARKLN